ncbi:heme exporter protein CcmD [Roseiarcus sp.]|uniref:heme exporter protein CcmD n=1 Tax=Roseiarcus sp. TaxID=1969460 RepID=UPI003C4E5A80
MMADPHIGFVMAAYSIAAVVLAVMIGSVLLDYRRLSASLDKATHALDQARGGAGDARS